MKKNNSYKYLTGSIVFVIAILLTAALVYFKPKPFTGLINLPAGEAGQPTTTTHYSLPTTHLFFAGDIMLSRNVDGKIIEANDYNLPFEKVADEVSKADIAFANLESPFNNQGNHSVEGSLNFDADPKAISGLNFAGFDILSTANNHTLDQGTDGLDYTLNLLKQNNILPIGTGTNCHQGQVIIKNNIKFGFLAYSYTALNDGGKTTDPLVCDANNLKQVSADILNLRSQVDYLIVSTHMGIEYTRTPTKAQTDFSHNAIDSGADLVIGNHPHWIQPVEQYKGKWIFYAMGNFVFDQMWSIDTTQGLTANFMFTNKTLTKIELKPVIIEDYCCPRWANPDETSAILTKIGLTSTVLMDNN